ncbi:MAG: hypothetical protein WA160_03405 [Pseudobdellovibrio sp.]
MWGCSAKIGNSLLIDSTLCTTTSALTDSGCTASSTTQQGVLEIQANSATMTVNMEKSDTVEITGTCHDLGRKNNRILVEAFAGDLNEAVDPYVSNGISSKCLNTSSGVATTEKCFSVTKGIGRIEDIGLPDQKDFPQCHNGQFGFSVRLGKILTDATLGVNYLIRFKLRTEEGSLSDTIWSRVSVVRKLTTPIIDSTTATPLAFQCNLKTSLARFNQNITYTLQRTFNQLSGAPSVAIAIPGFGATSASIGNYDYYDTGLVDGVTYNYSLVATESQYAGLYPVAQTSASTPISCPITKPVVGLSSAPTANTCPIGVSFFSPVATGIIYEIGAFAGTGWTGVGFNGANAGPVGCTTGSIQTANCKIAGLISGVEYSISVRAIGPSGEIGLWANEFKCRPL